MSAGDLFPSLDLGGTAVTPALLLAPMAGITHSGFRRLIADFGGYGALTTEMLSPPPSCARTRNGAPGSGGARARGAWSTS